MGQGDALSRGGATSPPSVARRALLAAAGAASLGAAALAGCRGRGVLDDVVPLPPGSWVGARHDRGHRVRDAAASSVPWTSSVSATTAASAPDPLAELRRGTWPAPTRRAAVLVLGAGVAGLAAARAFTRRGVDDVHLLELDDAPGGNARGHVMAGMACPLGAHYLPLPAPESTEVAEWLHEIGLLKTELGRTVADERHLCHNPQERLFFEGEWIDGLLPPAASGSVRLAQYRRFAARIEALRHNAQGARRFALPAHRSPRDAEVAALDTMSFAAWLARQGCDDAALLAYLDYCCRDDYGAGIGTVSAWAGVHYFASRHGFHAPGDEERERDAVFTWPEGNAWLAQRLAAPLGDRLHAGMSVIGVREERAGVQVLAWNERAGRAETWLAGTVVLALPLFVALRLVDRPSDALRTAAALLPVAPWLVANLQLEQPLLDRVGAPPAWDNVIHHAAGTSTSLGYVDAMHQSLRPYAAATVLSAYHALPAAERPLLLADDWRPWAERVLADLAPAHPDLRAKLRRIDLMRWGHAMAVPRPGTQRHPALVALRGARGRLRFAHADLAGYSVFEEAFTAGCEAAG